MTCRSCKAETVDRTKCPPCMSASVAIAKQRRAERTAAGLCKCGRQPRPEGTLCELCAARHRRTAAATRANHRQYGLCRQCTAPREEPSVFCLSHLLAHRNRKIAAQQVDLGLAETCDDWLRADLADEAWGLAPSWAPRVSHCLPPEGA